MDELSRFLAIFIVVWFVAIKISCLISVVQRQNRSCPNCRLDLAQQNAIQNGGVESLRAIPWIFAWMQNRLMLPALGASAAISVRLLNKAKAILFMKLRNWPFFSTRIGMLEMVFSKSDTGFPTI